MNEYQLKASAQQALDGGSEVRIRAKPAAVAEFEIHPTTSRIVQTWMDANEMDSAPKPIALMRRDRNGTLQVWSWHVSELGARQSIARAAANRPVR